MSDDTVLRDDEGLAYSYDNLRTQGWLDGHTAGLDAAVEFLRERAVALFRDRKDDDAIKLRRLADDMLNALRPGMEERAAYHAKNHPIAITETD